MIKVSIIIPVYNVEKYLPACLDSVLGQSLQELECICIDDASPDHCGEILDKYAARDSRISVLHLSENRKQGYARNRGLEKAEGEYVYFLDSDDMVSPNAMEELYLLAKQDNLDGVFFDSKVLVESEDLARFAANYIKIREGNYPDEVMDGSVLLDLFQKNGEWLAYVQRQFWRKDFLLTNKILSPENMEHEDELFSFMAILLAQRVRYLRKDFFIRRYRKDSDTTRAPHPKDFLGYFRIFCQMIEFVDEHQFGGPGVEWNIAHMYECMTRFLDDFEKRGNSTLWSSLEEQKSYRLFRSIVRSQEMLRVRDHTLWTPLYQYDGIWIYGAGRIARHVFERLHNCNFRIAGFLVTSPEGNPTRLFDLPVYPVDTIDNLPDGDVVIVAMSSTLHIGPSELLLKKGFPFFLYYNNKLTCCSEMKVGTK